MIISKNKIIFKNDYCEVCLYNSKKKKIAKAIIDKEDLDTISGYRWCKRSKRYNYAVSSINGKITQMHRVILGLKKNNKFEVVDHINENPLDNRKINLRIVTKSQNGMNSKKTKGYYHDKRRGNWRVEISVDNKKYYIGSFYSESEAIKHRLKAEEKFFGEFRSKNK